MPGEHQEDELAASVAAVKLTTVTPGLLWLLSTNLLILVVFLLHDIVP